MWIYPNLIVTHHSVFGQLDCFHILAIMNNFSRNICVRVFVRICFISLGYYSRRISGSYGNSMLNILNNCQNVFQNIPSFTFLQQCMRVLISPHPRQTPVPIFVFWITFIHISVTQHLVSFDFACPQWLKRIIFSCAIYTVFGKMSIQILSACLLIELPSYSLVLKDTLYNLDVSQLLDAWIISFFSHSFVGLLSNKSTST